MGQLRITCPNEFGRIHVAPILTDFLDQHPGMTADVLMLDRVVDLVEEGIGDARIRQVADVYRTPDSIRKNRDGG